MRKNNKFFYFISVFILLNCTKDAQDLIQTTFEFTLEEDHQPESYVFEINNTDFKINTEQYVKDLPYKFKYKISEGEGYYHDEKGNPIQEDVLVDRDILEFEYSYMPTAVGVHKVTVWVLDHMDNQKQMELNYTVDYAPFTALLSKGLEHFTINANNPLVVSILDGVNGEGTIAQEELMPVYSLGLSVKDGSGDFFYQDEKLEVSNAELLSFGTHDISYVPSSIGIHEITFTITAPDGGVKTVEEFIEVKHLDFDIISSARGTIVQLDTELPITINLQNQNNTSDITYTIAYQIEGQGTINNELDQTVVVGQENAIVTGEYQYNFISNVLGEKTVVFNIRDSNGQIKKDSVQFEVSNVPFAFTGSGASNTVFINQETDFNFNLRATGNTQNIKYLLTYEIIEGNGKLYDLKNNEIINGVPTEVAIGDIYLKYIPLTLEKNSIEFKVTDSYGQEGSIVPIDLLSQNVKLTFQTSVSQNEMIVKLKNPITVSLVEDIDYVGVTYELSYFITGGTAALFDTDEIQVESSSYFSFLPGEDELLFIPEIPGNYEVSFNLRDSNGQIITSTEQIIVSQTDYIFSAQFANATRPLGNTNTINFNVSPSASNNGATYNMNFQSNLNGSLEYLGNVYAPGQIIIILPGQSSGVFTPSVVGQYSLEFSATDSNSVTKEALATMRLENGEFNFLASSSPSTFFVYESASLSIDITQVVENTSASYEIMYTSESALNIIDSNSEIIPPGVFVPISIGASSFTVSTAITGGIGIDFVVRDNALIEKQKTVALTIKEKDYNLSAIASKNNEFINIGVPISLTLTELAENANDTYEGYFSASKQGHIEYDGNVYAFGDRFTVNSGTGSYTYFGAEQGQHGVNFTVTSSSGVIRTTATAIDYNVVDYNLTAFVGDNSLTVGDTTTLNFNINEISGSSTYRLKYILSSGSGELKDENNNIIAQGSYYNVSPGNFSWSMKAINEGTTNIQFTTINATGQEKTEIVAIEIIQKDYSFAAVRGNGGNLNVGDVVPFTATITELDSGGATYSAYYTSSGEGTFSLGTNVYSSGQSFPIQVGDNSFTYTGNDEGSHALQITVVSSSNVTKTVSSVMDFEYIDYSLSVVSGNTEILQGEIQDIDINIFEESPGATYQIRYAILSGDANFKDAFGRTLNSGIYYSVSPGEFIWEFSSQTSGISVIQFIALNSTGLEVSKTISLDIVDYVEEFDLSTTQASGTKSKDVPFSMSSFVNAPNGHDTNVSYQMYFNFSGANSGYVILNGTTYQEGDIFDVNYGNTSFQFVPTVVGSFEVKFIVSNSTGEQEDEQEFLEAFIAPTVEAYGKSEGYDCGYSNCEYRSRLYFIKSGLAQSTANGGAELSYFEIKIEGKTFQGNWSDLTTSGTEVFFLLENDKSHDFDLQYRQKEYTVRIRDNNDVWSETITGEVLRN